VRRRLVGALLLLAAPALAQEPAFHEGDVLGYADVTKLEPVSEAIANVQTGT
jgi:hypothetical protein